jgi:hypothetical protein
METQIFEIQSAGLQEIDSKSEIAAIQFTSNNTVLIHAVGGTPMLALLDTGAHICVMSLQAYKKLDERFTM